jgi:hypothetical protein
MVYGKWYPSWFGARVAAGGADCTSGVGAAGTVARIDLRVLRPPTRIIVRAKRPLRAPLSCPGVPPGPSMKGSMLGAAFQLSPHVVGFNVRFLMSPEFWLFGIYWPPCVRRRRRVDTQRRCPIARRVGIGRQYWR